MSNKCPYCGAPGGGAAACSSCQHHKPNSSVNSGRKPNPPGPGGGSGCFPQGTLIQTPTGYKDIATIKKGDFVSSVSLEKCKLVPQRVLSVVSHSQCKIWKIGFEDQHYIRTTPIHSFRVGNNIWKVASKIQRGDHIIHCDERGIVKSKIVTESSLLNEIADVFNIIVEKEYNFIADGALVHSFTHLRCLRSLIWSFSMPILIDKCDNFESQY